MAAQTPLFSDDQEDIASILGIKNLPPGGSSQELFEEALAEARYTLWEHLGQSTISTIQATTYTTDPTSDEEYIKVVARRVEIDLVRYALMATMPIAYKGGKAEFKASFNTDGKFKYVSDRQLFDVRGKLWEKVEQGLMVLKGETTSGSKTTSRFIQTAQLSRVALYRYSSYRGDVLNV